MRFRIRYANIRSDLRPHFELYGKEVVALALGLGTVQGGGGIGAAPLLPTQALMIVHGNQDAAAEWLREERDRKDRHQTVMTLVEWFILLFVIAGVGIDLAIWLRPTH